VTSNSKDGNNNNLPTSLRAALAGALPIAAQHDQQRSMNYVPSQMYNSNSPQTRQSFPPLYFDTQQFGANQQNQQQPNQQNQNQQPTGAYQYTITIPGAPSAMRSMPQQFQQQQNPQFPQQNQQFQQQSYSTELSKPQQQQQNSAPTGQQQKSPYAVAYPVFVFVK